MILLLSKIKNLIIEILFPKFCFNCGKEGTYLCEDCLAIIDILENSYCLCEKPFRLPLPGKCPRCQSKKLNGLYFAVSYQSVLIKKLIHSFKYEPLAKELAKDLSSLIITHFVLLNKNGKNVFSEFILIPVPLHKKRLKWRGFNQAKEIAKELAQKLHLPLNSDSLFRIKETPAQVELSREKRKENIKAAFAIKNAENIKNKKIFLVDDVYTTGATMEECARLLKEAGAKEVWGVVVARD